MRVIFTLFLLIGALTQGQAAHHETDEGADIFQANCAYCHNQNLPRMPTRDQLLERDVKEVYSAITSGIMAPYSRDLSPDERRSVSEYVTGKKLGDYASGAAAIPKEAYCANQAKSPVINANSGWNSWGNDNANTRFQTEEKAGFTASDVPNLKYKWAFGVPAVSSMSGQPTIADGRLFFGTWSGLLVALDAESGCALWVYEAGSGIRTAISLGELSDGSISLFFGDLSGKVYSVDPNTGQKNWAIQGDDHDHARITGTPVYYDNRLYVPLSSLEEVAGAMPDYECCTFRGGLLSVDAQTGETIWKTYTVAEPTKQGKNKLGVQIWAPNGAAIWTAPTIDPETRTIYAVTGDSYSHPAAPESDAVMAFDMDTGAIKWTTQTLAGDAFTTACLSPETMDSCPDNHGPDLDFGSSPILVTNSDGERLLLAGQKSGWLYALIPSSGALKWKVKVGPGGVVGGIEWGFAVDKSKAYVAIAGAWELGPGEAGGISAIDLNTGAVVWKAPPSQTSCLEVKERCSTGQLAAVTAIDGAVFSGSLDGYLRAYDSTSGKVIWEYDTRNTYDSVNGIKAMGGSLNGPGPAIAAGHLYVNSGYGMWNMWLPGNALIAFSVNGE